MKENYTALEELVNRNQFYRAGLLSIKQKKYGKALEYAFNTFERGDYFSSGDLFSRLKNNKQAKECINRLEKQDNFVNAGRLAVKIKDKELVKKYAEKIAKQRYVIWAAEISARVGNKNEAKEYIERIAYKNYYDSAARVSLILKDIPLARSYLEEALKKGYFWQAAHILLFFKDKEKVYAIAKAILKSSRKIKEPEKRKEYRKMVAHYIADVGRKEALKLDSGDYTKWRLDVYDTRKSCYPYFHDILPNKKKDKERRIGIKEKISHEQKEEIINEFNNLLDKRQKDILEKRLGIDDYPRTLEEIGKIYGLTRERVRQIEGKAIRKYRRNNGLLCRMGLI